MLIYFCHYCFRGDWLLGFLYRSSSVQLSVAGLQPISSQDRKIINVDLSSVVSKCVCALSIASLMFVLNVLGVYEMHLDSLSVRVTIQHNFTTLH